MQFVAFDLGASSGKLLLGKLTDERLVTERIHEFKKFVMPVNGHLYIDILRIHNELMTGLKKAVKLGGRDVKSIGLDTFSNDYGFIDKNGKLLGPVHYYRDSRTEGVLKEIYKKICNAELHQRTGNQNSRFNTLVQLYSMILDDERYVMEMASNMLFLPDLLNFFLTGIRINEYTLSSISGFYNYREKAWDGHILDTLGIPRHLFTNTVPPCTRLGQVNRWVKDELNTDDLTATVVAQHDTASAVLGVPNTTDNFAYISSGTWSLIGTETNHIIATEETLKYNIANEGGVHGRNRLLKNVMGLWLIQQCKAYFDSQGMIYSFEDLVEMSKNEEEFRSIIDPDDERFFEPGNMPIKIQQVCRETNQPIPETVSQLARCIQESLALKYRYAIEKLEGIVGHKIPVIHVVGGGSNNGLLCQFTANSTGKITYAGPSDATAMGNILSQMMAFGYIDNVIQARELLKRSTKVQEYVPNDTAKWDAKYQEFVDIFKMD